MRFGRGYLHHLSCCRSIHGHHTDIHVFTQIPEVRPQRGEGRLVRIKTVRLARRLTDCTPAFQPTTMVCYHLNDIDRSHGVSSNVVLRGGPFHPGRTRYHHTVCAPIMHDTEKEERMQRGAASSSQLAQAQERIRGTFIEQIGFTLLTADDEHAVATMPFTPALQQLTGVFHAGALVTLADTTATFACMYWATGGLDGRAEQFPFTIQLSSNFIRNTNQGTVQAEAKPLHRGRTTMVVETQVTDTAGRLLIVVTTTHLMVTR